MGKKQTKDTINAIKLEKEIIDFLSSEEEYKLIRINNCDYFEQATLERNENKDIRVTLITKE